MLRTRTALVGAGAAAAVLVAGCGSQTAATKPLSGSPHQQVQTAFDNLIKGDTLTASLHLGADASSLLTFASRTGGGLQAKQASALAGAAISFTVHSTSGSLESLRTAAQSQKNSQFDVAFSDQGRRYAELRNVSQNVYLQADVKGLVSLLGQPASAYDHALAGAKQIPYATALMTGHWLEVQGTQAQKLLKQYTGAAGNTVPTPNPAQRKQFLAGLERLFSKDVTVRRVSSGAGTSTYALTANPRQVAGSFLSSLTTMQPMLAGRMPHLSAGQVPSRTITFQAVVSGNRLSRLSFDLAQLVQGKSVPQLPLQVDFSTASQSVGAPSGAQVVDLNKLVNAFLSASRGGLGSGSGGSFSPLTPASPPAA